VAFFEEVPQGDGLEFALMYAEQHLAHWPAKLREFWGLETQHPIWPLVRCLRMGREFRQFAYNDDIEALSNITQLYGVAEHFPLKNIAAMPQLTHLNLHFCSGGGGIDVIGKCQHLTHLSFTYSSVWDFHFLGKLKELTHLKLENCRSVRDLRVLTKLKKIKQLQIVDCPNLEIRPQKLRMKKKKDIDRYLGRLARAY